MNPQQPDQGDQGDQVDQRHQRHPLFGVRMADRQQQQPLQQQQQQMSQQQMNQQHMNVTVRYITFHSFVLTTNCCILYKLIAERCFVVVFL